MPWFIVGWITAIVFLCVCLGLLSSSYSLLNSAARLIFGLYVDDTELIEYTTASDIPNAIMKLQNSVESIHEWCRSRKLQLNLAKTELIWFGSKASLKKTVHIYLNLYFEEPWV